MPLTITNRTFNKNIDQLKNGEIFTVEESDKDTYELFSGVFMKIEGNKDCKGNAVNLNTGLLYHINKNMILRVINAELII